MDFTRDMGERLLASGAQAFLGVFTLSDLVSSRLGLGHSQPPRQLRKPLSNL